jgi:hypothetical protein
LSFVAFTDPHNARLLWISAGGLFAVGVLLTVGTILWWRRAGNEHPALAKLETMRLARRPRPTTASPAATGGAAGSGGGEAGSTVDESPPIELGDHPSGPVDVPDESGDADVTAAGEHPAAGAGAAEARAAAESAPGIDPLLRPVEATD